MFLKQEEIKDLLNNKITGEILINYNKGKVKTTVFINEKLSDMKVYDELQINIEFPSDFYEVLKETGRVGARYGLGSKKVLVFDESCINEEEMFYLKLLRKYF